MGEYKPTFEAGDKLVFKPTNGQKITGTVGLCEATPDGGEKIVFLNTMYYLLRVKDSDIWNVCLGPDICGHPTTDELLESRVPS